jgi:hypothetical protein
MLALPRLGAARFAWLLPSLDSFPMGTKFDAVARCEKLCPFAIESVEMWPLFAGDKRPVLTLSVGSELPNLGLI